MNETNKATPKLINIPKKPKPSGDIPNSQFSDEFSSGFINLKTII